MLDTAHRTIRLYLCSTCGMKLHGYTVAALVQHKVGHGADPLAEERAWVERLARVPVVARRKRRKKKKDKNRKAAARTQSGARATADPVAGQVTDSLPPRQLHPFYDSRQWQGLRYRALRLYGRTCMACNRTDGEMHVDHIKPKSRYPELALDFDNLQILCRTCNMGKGAHDETDWRPHSRVIKP